MIEHAKHNYYIDIIYCPQTHAWADLNHRRGDTDPGMDECGDCGELFEVKDLQEAAA